jgi:hypothetical protein
VPLTFPEQEHDFRKQLYARAEDIEHSIQQHLHLYLSTSCRALCEKMQLELPRELRDTIYDYVLDNGVRLVDNNHINRTLKPRYFPSAPQLFDMGHLAEISYVGKATRDELADSYYRGSIFSFDVTWTWDGADEDLRRSLYETWDPWHVVAPLSKCVRNVQLVVEAFNSHAYDKSLKALNVLKRLKSRIRINIRLEGSQYFELWAVEFITTAAPELFPQLNALSAKGHTVSVEIAEPATEFEPERKPTLRLVGDDFTEEKLEQLLQHTQV